MLPGCILCKVLLFEALRLRMLLKHEESTNSLSTTQALSE